VTKASLTLTDDDAAGMSGDAAVTVNENETDVEDYGVTGAPSTAAVVWSLEGVDAAHFWIDANGTLAFQDPPDFESPADDGSDNVYDVTVKAATGAGRSPAGRLPSPSPTWTSHRRPRRRLSWPGNPLRASAWSGPSPRCRWAHRL
jgi:hypothetical protein